MRAFRVQGFHSCRGCGVEVQSVSHDKPGFIPSTAADKFSDGWRKRVQSPRGQLLETLPSEVEIARNPSSRFRSKALMMYCQRCYRLQTYGTDSSIDEASTAPLPTPGSRIIDEAVQINELMSTIPDDAVCIMVVDILDFESSIVPELYEALSRRKLRTVTVINKMDSLPIDERQWTQVLNWVTKTSKLIRSCRGVDGKLDVILISSTNEMGFSELEERLQQYISPQRRSAIYVIGRTNSGKSSFVTRFLRFIGYKHLGCIHYKRGVGGITRSAIPSTTQGFIRVKAQKELEIIDTPGIISTHGIQNHFLKSEDFRNVCSGHRLQPLSFALKEGKSLLVGALCRVNIASGTSAVVSCFVSPKITLHLAETSRAVDLLNRKAGTFLYPPHLTPDMGTTHPIVSRPWIRHRVRVHAGPATSKDDIVVPGLGWFSIYGSGHKSFDVWLPEGVRLFRRPAMLPKFIRRFGSSPSHHRQRGRGLIMNRRKKRIVESLRSPTLKDEWRRSSEAERASNADPPTNTNTEFVSEMSAEEFRVA
jgi:ribosome biogenesis GTPase A